MTINFQVLNDGGEIIHIHELFFEHVFYIYRLLLAFTLFSISDQIVGDSVVLLDEKSDFDVY